MAAAVLAFSAPAPVAAQQRPMLVDYLPVTAHSAGEIPGTKNSSLTRVLDDSAVLAVRIGRAAPAPVVQARALSIMLPESSEVLSFDDLVVRAVKSGYGLYSRDQGTTTSIAIVVMGEDVAGTIRHDGGVYGVRPLGGGLTAVYLYDAAQLRGPPEDAPDYVIPDVDPQESSLLPEREASEAGDGRDGIDVLVVYSESARQAAGNIDAYMALLVLLTHVRYENSGITTRLRMVHSYETSYVPEAETPEDDEDTDLLRLRTPGDGFLDEALEERERFKADIVVLLVRAKYCGGGLAYKLDHTPGSAEWAFAVSGIGPEHCSEYDADTFAHEIGHIQGASHHLEYYGGVPEQPYTYGHGLCNGVAGWHTVMAYGDDSCPRPIPHFSNPRVQYEGTPTGSVELHDVTRLINETAIHVANFRSRAGTPTHTLPLFISAAHQTLQGFVRIINRSERAGVVTIRAVDDAGQRFGPVTLSLDARATRHFNSDNLRDGAPEKGLSGSIENGEGNWRLELETDLDIEPLAYTRPRGDGFLTSTHDVVAEGESMRWHVPTFNPGNNAAQHSWLRVANVSGGDAEVLIEGLDDRGASPPGGSVRFTLPPNAARMLSASALEEGASESDFAFEGRFGDGAGKWQLFVSADRPIQVMSLLLSESGHLTNLSSTTRAGVAGRQSCFLPGAAEVYLDVTSLGLRRLTGLERAVCTTWLDLRFNHISDLSSLSGLTALTRLDLKDNQVSDLSPLSGLTALTRLDLRENNVSDLSPLSGLTALTKLDLDDNQISDIGPLVSNPGLDSGDIVTLTNNPLNARSRNTHIPALRSRGVSVSF